MTNKELKVPRVTMDEDNLKLPEELPRVNGQKRTKEDFIQFCRDILKHANYDDQRNEEVHGSRSPPLDSSGSSVNSVSTNSGQEDKPSGDETDNDGDDSHDLVTCYCGKPFAGRAMIECSLCFTWIHLSCARIRKTNIPEVFNCAICKSGQQQQSPPSSPSPSLKRLKRARLSPPSSPSPSLKRLKRARLSPV